MGDRAYVNPVPPRRNRVRSAPNNDTNENIIGFIEPGAGMIILKGPECYAGQIWWKIETEDGLVGWTSEGDGSDYWLLPLR